MRSSARTLLTVLILALLLVPEAIFLHRCACGRIFDCCCREKAGMAAASCQLHHGMAATAAMAHCSGDSASRPASVQKRPETRDRLGTPLSRQPAIQLLPAGWTAETPREVRAGLCPNPLTPPPRRLLLAA
jgi:hypothetical protein